MHLHSSLQQSVLCGTAALAGFALIFGSTDISPFEVLAVAVAICTFFVVVMKRTFSVPASAHNYALAGFLALTVAQLLYIQEPNVVYTLITIYLIGVYALIQFWYMRYPAILEYSLYGYLAAASVSSLLGVVGYVMRLFSVEWMTEFFFWGDEIRISMFYSDPVVYGAFLVPALLFFSYTSCISNTSKAHVLYTSAALFIFVNLILSGSRGAWLNFVVAAIVFFILYKPLREKTVLIKAFLLSISACILATLIIFVVQFGERTYYAATLEHRYQVSDRPRLEHLQTAPDQLTGRSVTEVILGSGSGRYEVASEKNFSSHNVYLRLLYEQGIVGVILFVLFIAALIRKLWCMRFERSLYVSLLLAVLFGVLVQGLVVDILHWRHFWFVIAFIL